MGLDISQDNKEMAKMTSPPHPGVLLVSNGDCQQEHLHWLLQHDSLSGIGLLTWQLRALESERVCFKRLRGVSG